MRDIISVTSVVEHVFCPKFTYYIHVLGLKQYEEKRGTVKAGKTLHSKHERTNINFLSAGIEGKKLVAVFYYSKKYNFIGKIDEAVETPHEVILIERKYTDNAIIGSTMKTQLGLLSILLDENIEKPVNLTIVVFSKNERKIIKVNIDHDMKIFALNKLDEVKKIISNGINPDSWFDNRCINCCFRKICPIGSLNSS